MTWQRAGLAAGIAFGLTLVETAPHAATMVIACIAFYVVSKTLAGKSVLADGTPITWQSGAPVAAILIGLVLVENWPHAVTLGMGIVVIRAICARLDPRPDRLPGPGFASGRRRLSSRWIPSE